MTVGGMGTFAPSHPPGVSGPDSQHPTTANFWNAPEGNYVMPRTLQVI